MQIGVSGDCDNHSLSNRPECYTLILYESSTDQSLIIFFHLLTVVQSDEKYSLDHVIDIELFTQLLPGPEGAADLCNGVIIVINAVRHRVFRL